MLLGQSLQHFYLLPVVFGEQRLQTLDLLSGLEGIGKLNKKSLFRIRTIRVPCETLSSLSQDRLRF